MGIKGHVSNVIELDQYRTATTSHPSNPISTAENAKVTDISQRRKAIISSERRNVKRTILSEFVGVLVLIPGKGLQKCTLRDISEVGLSFDLERRLGSFTAGEQISMRVYLNHRTYFTFLVQIENAREHAEEDAYRHGGQFVPDTMNEVALYHFIRFIETVSTNLRADEGDVLMASSADS